jgi:predicted RND superfamily exporter protein
MASPTNSGSRLHADRSKLVNGSILRLRPKFMTMATTFVGFIPIMWDTGTGSDVWKRIAAPMVGGIFTSFILELVVYPAIYEIWKWHFEMKRAHAAPQPAALAAVPSPEAALVTVTTARGVTSP